MVSRAVRGGAFAALVFLLVQVGALALVPDFSAKGYQQVPDPQDPTNSLVYLALILVMTGLMLAAFRFDLGWVVRVVIVATSGLLAWYVLSVFLPGPVAVVVSLAVPIALWVYPEWYVIDAAGVLMGAGAAGLFGISFGLLPALVLLAVLAIYDAISVYGTEHMLDLAEGVMDLRIPVVLVIPLTLDLSILDESPAERQFEGDETEDADEASNEGQTETVDRDDGEADGEETGETDDEEAEEAPDIEERDAFFIGLGDAVMPTVLVASAAHFAPAPALGLPYGILNLPALTAMIGTFLGLFVLLRMVFRGRAHAGLPLLNGGAIGGYIVGALAAGIPLTTALGL